MRDCEPLECTNCGRQLYKKVCFLMIDGEVVSDIYGIEEIDFCSKKCAFEWLEKCKHVQFFDVDLIKEERYRR